MFFRRTGFLAVGGCDPALLLMEYADLCIRFTRLGRVRLVNRVVITSDRRVAAWGRLKANLLVLHVHIPRPLLAVQLATALLATPLVMLALHAPVPLLALGSATFGVALAVVNVLVQTSLQESIPRDFLSRVSSIFSLVTMGLGPIGFALCGPVANLIGTELALGLGACALLASVAALLASYDIQRFTRFRHAGAVPHS